MRPPDAVSVGMLAGYLMDRVVADPRRGHPVAAFGTIAHRLEQRLYAPTRVRGVVGEAILVGGVVGAAALTRRLPWVGQVLAATAATWAVLGGRTLEREGEAMHDLLATDDLAAARQRITHLVGRDPSRLEADDLARATVESLAENSADAVVAPLVWGAVAGVPGLLGYRAVNTLDAMWGHRSDRYREFGWAAARLDDLANWLPARLTVAITVLLARDPAQVCRVVRRDAPAHPSPNAGPVEAAWAAALGVRLGGANTYDGVTEQRGVLGDGPAVTARTIPHAVRRLRRQSLAALAICVGLRVVTRRLVVPQRDG